MKYPHLAARIFNTPLLIHPQKLDAIIAGLSDRLLGAVPLMVASPDGLPKLAPELFSTRRGEQSDRGYRVVEGVAVLNVNGALLHRSRLDVAESTFLVGYNDLAADLEDAMSHPDIHAVLQVYDSPGGEAQGAFEYAQRVFDLRGRKPMQAIADGMALSAAYLGASAADEVAVTATGYAGSVGVVSRHVDFSRALDQDGITVTHIFAGAHKVDGNPYEPLPADVRSAWQAEIDGLYTMFVDAVARHRGMEAAAVRKTQAASYSGVAAVASGLADRIATTDQLISELAAQRGRSFPVGPTARSNANDKGASMSGISPNEAGGHQAAAALAGAPAVPSAFTQANVDAARAEGRDEGALTERTRVSGIFAHEAAAGRTQLAIQCVTSGLSVEQAGAVLGAAPVATAAPVNAFATAMAAVGNPDVSGVEAASGAQTDEAALASQIVASFRGSR